MTYLSRDKLYLLFFSQLLAIAPLIFVLPKWLFGFWFLSCIWRIQILRRDYAFPSLPVKFIALLVGLSGLALSFDKLLSIEVFISFFLISLSLKAIEMHSRSDALLLVSLNFICVGVSFIFYQNIEVSVYAVIALIVVVQAWISLYRRKQYGLFQQFRFAMSVVLKALPVMLVLFLVMPRLNQLWQMPSQSQTGTTGISDSMSPGEFSQLTQSNAVAFRVSFSDEESIPSSSERYWRTMVFDQFDGKTWRQSEIANAFGSAHGASTRRPHPQWNLDYDDEELIRYSVLLEPHQTRWLFTLMAPVSASSDSLKINFKRGARIESRFKVAARSEYSVVSAVDYAYARDELSSIQRSLNTGIPAQGNERSRAYAQTLRSKYGEGIAADKSIIQEVLSIYESSFFYTLQPPVITTDFVDGFLFQSKRGFCEHFSGSFTYLMRASGIPARVVVGYQGGELNPMENYLVVRQRDAHAWAEVWIEGEGWTRIDPTAAVAPSRIEQGLENSINSEDRALVGRGFSTEGFIAWLQLRVDFLNYSWQRWVVNYGSDEQSDFFKRFLGGDEAWRIALFFVGACVLLSSSYYAYAFFPVRKNYVYQESNAYSLHLKRLEKLGFEKRASETAAQFASRVSKKRPEWRAELVKIASLYTSLVYNPKSAQKQKELSLLCRAWKPKKIP